MVIITLTVIFALGLSGMAMNTSVQVHKTERYNKATDLAEMGIIYYKTKIDRLVSAAFIGKTLKSQAELPILLEGIAKEIGEIGRADSEHKVAGNDFAYEIRDLAVDVSQRNKLTVSFKSVGNADGDKRELTMRVNYIINEGKPLPVYKISDPGTFASSSDDCHNGKKIENMKCFYKEGQSVPQNNIVNSTLKIIGNEDIDHFNNLTSSDIYLLGDILLSKANNLNNLRIHITGDLNKNAVSEGFKNFGGSTLVEVEGNASIGIINNTKDHQFELIVGKNLSVDRLTSNNNGKIIVFGDANISQIELTPNMKVCVFGKYSGHQPKPSFINVYGEENFLEDTVCGQYATGGIPVTLEANPEESISYH